MTSFSSPGCLDLFPSSTHTRPLPSSLSPPFFLPFPLPPQDGRTIQENLSGGLTEENGLAQSPPHTLTPSREDGPALLWRWGQRKVAGSCRRGPSSCCS